MDGHPVVARRLDDGGGVLPPGEPVVEVVGLEVGWALGEVGLRHPEVLRETSLGLLVKVELVPGGEDDAARVLIDADVAEGQLDAALLHSGDVFLEVCD